MELPLSDPQFWLVSAGAALALGLALRRARQRARDEAETPCASCPKPGTRAPASKERRAPKLGAVLAGALAAAPALEAVEVERQVAAMGTTLRVAVEVPEGRAAALEVAERLIREVEAAEARLSTWRAGSALAALNRAPVGAWVESPALGEVVAAGRCARETGLAFHPALGRLVAAWDLRGRGRVPTASEIAAALRGLDGLGFEDGGPPQRVRRTADVVLEEGGFGKGAGLDAALDALARLPAPGNGGVVRLDLGGQLAWANAERPVVLTLADPRERARGVLELTLGDRRASLSSSGNSEKRLSVGGEAIGHLLDPRTGRPAADFGSVAVVAPQALAADCLSTALFVMGPERGMAWLAAQERRIEAVYLVVEGERLRARLTPGLAASARPLAEGVTVEVDKSSS